MVRLLARIQSESAENHFYLSDKKARALRADLAAMRPGAAAVLKWEAHFKLGQEEQHIGNERAAIEHFEEALKLLPAIESDIAPPWIARLHYRLAVAYLRHGETKNCALRHAAESCILPIRGSGIHVDQEPSRRATVHFEELLERAPVDSEPYLTGRWLLNIAYMTIDGYPDEVPERYLIPPESFVSDESFPVFANVAMKAGLGTFSLSGGAVAEDFLCGIGLIKLPVYVVQEIDFLQSQRLCRRS